MKITFLYRDLNLDSKSIRTDVFFRLIFGLVLYKYHVGGWYHTSSFGYYRPQKNRTQVRHHVEVQPVRLVLASLFEEFSLVKSLVVDSM